MTIVYEYSHLGGREILHVRFAALKAEIEQVVREVKVGPRSKVSRERTKKGRLLHSPIDLNAQFRAAPLPPSGHCALVTADWPLALMAVHPASRVPGQRY